MAIQRKQRVDWFRERFSEWRQNKYLAFVVAVGGGYLGWYALASVFPHNLMPYPMATFSLTWELVVTGRVWPHLEATATRTLGGFIGSFVVGSIIGIIMGGSDFGEKFTTPYLLVGLTIPGIAWAAIFVIIFGLGFISPTLATIVTVYPFISLYIWKGVENIDGNLLEMGRAFETSNLRLLRRVVIPNIAPALFTAARHGIALSWKVETTAELFASRFGVGAILIQNYRTYRYAEVWAWALVFVIVLLLVELLVLRPLERKTFEYRDEIDFQFVG